MTLKKYKIGWMINKILCKGLFMRDKFQLAHAGFCLCWDVSVFAVGFVILRVVWNFILFIVIFRGKNEISRTPLLRTQMEPGPSHKGFFF